MNIYEIYVFHTLQDYFDYTSSEAIPMGTLVLVPFQQHSRLGIVLNIKTNSQYPILKSILAVLSPDPILTAPILTLCRWISSYYHSPLSKVLPLALPKKARTIKKNSSAETKEYLELNLSIDLAQKLIPKRAKKQQQLIQVLKEQSSISKTELLKQGFSTQQIKALLALNIIKMTAHNPVSKITVEEKPLNLSPAKILNEEQNHVLTILNQHLHHFQCFLLMGITGSGKTEVYLQISQAVLLNQKQVLVLVPEIGLTPQLFYHFAQRFREKTVVIHSNLSEIEKHQAWDQAKNNEAKIIIGTRTAVFTPLPKLGLIIIDEEHDLSFKQMDRVLYSARDSALVRAQKEQIPVLLGSATPSLESIYNVKKGRYYGLELKQKALNSPPPQYQFIDIRALKLEEGFAEKTLSKIEEHLNQGNQVLIFLNRRGFSPVYLCHQCGFIPECSACTSYPTFYRNKNKLICHHCGLEQKPPEQCPSCSHTQLVPFGLGTQRLEAFLAKRFPKIQQIRIDRDNTKAKNSIHEHLNLIRSENVQLIIGTQMLAKGHHFPRLTLVVIIDADSGLYGQDFRCIEHLGQLLTQVAGRAGRSHEAGEILLQTRTPHHPLLNSLVQQGYRHFAEELLLQRKKAMLPPYCYLAIIRACDKNSAKALAFLTAIKDKFAHKIELMGPAPAPLERKQHYYRIQLLFKSPSRQQLQTTLIELKKWVADTKLGHQLRWAIEVDPLDLT